MQRASEDPVLSFHRVFHSFGQVKVLNDLSFSVHSGELLILLGPNGAGKSTTMALATGQRPPGEGEVRVFGARAESLGARSRFAFVPQEIAFPQHVTGRQVLRFMSAHAATPLSAEKLLADLQLASFIDVPVRHLSGGQKRLLSIAAAFVRGTRFVVLDEPTVGLDLEVRRRLFGYWREFVATGGTLFMTTHHLHEAEELASRVIVLNRGRVVHTGSPSEIKRDYGVRRISFRCEQSPPAAVGASLCPLTGHWRIESREAEMALRELVLWGGARDIEVSPLPLEDVLQQVVRREEPESWG